MTSTENMAIISPTEPVHTVTPPEVLVWVDTETTGLFPYEGDVMLELGVVITDYDLNILKENSWYVRDEGWLEKLKENEFVYNMHLNSGLVDELLALPEYQHRGDQTMSWGRQSASYLAWKWLTKELHLPGGKYPLCGSSVHFDREFIEKHMPVFHGFFHYRNIDISTLKELCKIFNPGLYSRIYNETGFDKANSKHRVLPDIRDTLAEAKFYFDNFLFQEIRGINLMFDGQDPIPGL